MQKDLWTLVLNFNPSHGVVKVYYIVNDPNSQDDPRHIVQHIGKVVTVSLETMKILKSLPELV
jgi:hypothetical protein